MDGIAIKTARSSIALFNSPEKLTIAASTFLLLVKCDVNLSVTFPVDV